MKAIASVMLSVALVTGCAAQIAVPGKRHWPLLAPNLISSRSATQVVHASFGARSITLQCALDLAGDQLTLIGLTTLGQRAYTVRYNGRQIVAERAAFVPAGINAERLLADVQLAFWPIEALRPEWQRLGYELTEPFPGLRRLRQNDRIVSEVHFSSGDAWNGRVWLVNLRYGYSLTIDTTTDTTTTH